LCPYFNEIEVVVPTDFKDFSSIVTTTTELESSGIKEYSAVQHGDLPYSPYSFNGSVAFWSGPSAIWHSHHALDGL
jgi:hypothetical protein